jgi:beta-RFAP synthase
VVVLPGVLMAAGHAKNDMASEVRLARERHPALDIHMGRALDVEPRLLQLCQLRYREALAGRPAAARSLAPLVERGARSGIGIGAFDAGGFLIDGGKGPGDAPAPVVARVPFPPGWRIVLILDRARRGLSGPREAAAFRELPPFPAELAGHLCRLALMRLLPGLAEADLDAVGSSIGEIQDRIGDHFAPAQGGRYSSPRVAEILQWLRDSGFAGTGQSSWGPTGFAIVGGEEPARALADEMRRRFGGDGDLTFRVCRGRNRGAEIRAADLVATG